MSRHRRVEYESVASGTIVEILHRAGETVRVGEVIAFVGVKMIGAAWFTIPIFLSLAVILGLLGASIAASLLWPGHAPAVKTSADVER